MSKTTTTLISIIGFLIAIVFFYFDHHQQLSHIIISLGPIGIVLSILLMAALCMSPIPSEGLFIIFLKVYGLWMGTFYSWTGYAISSIFIYYLAKKTKRLPFIQNQVDKWKKSTSKWGTKDAVGMIFIRFLPLPAFLINYILGLHPDVKFYRYFWTGLISILPYYVEMDMVFLGISNKIFFILIAISLSVILWLIGAILNKRLNKSQESNS